MIDRYTRPEMAAIWNDEKKYECWLAVELAADEAWSKLGHIPMEDVEKLRKNAKFDVDRIAEIESVTHHDVIAFTRCLSESLGPEKKWVHYGLTSTDVVDTAQGYQLKQANDILRKDLCDFTEILAKRAREFKYTGDIQTTYQARQSNEGRVIEALGTMVKARPGNYLVFLPSYSYLNEVAEDFAAAYPEIATVVQTGNMDSEAREEFLDNFKADPQSPLVGFAVLGGIFAEGIDLKGSRLIGVAVISVGLPRLNPETDQLRDFFASQGYNGFQYAYQLPGLNKVFQAGGRVIRDEHDVGVILLIDSRFASRRYTEFYPQQWQHFRITYNQNQLQNNLNNFWQRHKK